MKIVVIGDIILDGYIDGEVNRINPEAPVPVLDIKEIRYELGGASNVANNIRQWTEDVFLIGYGDAQIRRMLKARKIKHKLFRAKTTIKIRVGNPQIVRLDLDNEIKNDEKEIAKLVEKLNPEIVVISDYAKGSITQKLFNKLKKYKLIVDPKPKNGIDYSGAYLIIPNEKESKEVKGQAKNVLITEGANGMTLNYKNHFPTQAKEVYDVIGAGDTVVASIAYKLSLGEELIDSVQFANKMAGLVVSRKGTSLPDKII